MYNLDDLLDSFRKKTIDSDFEFKEANKAVYWKKDHNNVTFKITIGFKGYPVGYYLQSPFVDITFNEIEKKIINTSKNLNIEVDTQDHTIKKKNFEDGEFDFEIFKTKIDSEEKFDKVFEAVLKFIKIGAFPFFEKYQDLNNVAELLSKLKPQEVVPYIQGSKLFCKTILILKEANHPNYEEKRDEFYSVLKTQANKKEVYADQLRLFESLFFS